MTELNVTELEIRLPVTLSLRVFPGALNRKVRQLGQLLTPRGFEIVEVVRDGRLTDFNENRVGVIEDSRAGVLLRCVRKAKS